MFRNIDIQCMAPRSLNPTSGTAVVIIQDVDSAESDGFPSSGTESRMRVVGRFCSTMWWFRIVVLYVCPVTLAPFVVWSGDEAIVDLHSARRLRASSISVAPQDASRLVLELKGESILVRRTVEWNRVRRIEASRSQLDAITIPNQVEIVVRESQVLPVRELTLTPSSDGNRSAAISEFVGNRLQIRNQLPSLSDSLGFVPPLRVFRDRSVENAHVDLCENCTPIPFGVVVGVRDVSHGERMSPVLMAPQPTELVVSARPFNRSGLADWNSLELFVQGRTASGQPCPVRGSLRCTLWGRRQAVVSSYGDMSLEEPREIAILGQWSQFVESFEANESGVQRIVLPLDPRIPDHDLSWSAKGLLAVEIDIPGQGRLTAAIEPIPLRQQGTIRGGSIEQFGSSFLPNQSTSGNVRAIGAWPQSLSGLRPDRRLFSVQP